MTHHLAHLLESGEEHLLRDHLDGVAGQASKFASVFRSAGIAEVIGQWHDLGKFQPAFQQYLQASVHAPDSVRRGQVRHSVVGGIHAIRHLKGMPVAARTIAHCITAHHAGLVDEHAAEQSAKSLQSRLRDTSEYEAVLAELGTMPSLDSKLNLTPGISRISDLSLSLWIRMLFSCLVDADRLDTARFTKPEQEDRRGQYPTLEQLRDTLHQYMERLGRNSTCDTDVNRTRREVLTACLNSAVENPGLFTLTVPTGGGKTLSSLSFALDHACRHGLRRVIYVIPYTSIIEQTADVFRGVFQDLRDTVIEHHSNFVEDRGKVLDEECTAWDLAVENWDAPLIVTTSVQFFESLFTCRTSQARKLHNVAGSVVILDEAQNLNPGLLDPTLLALKELVCNYSASVVLCTATQPALFDLGKASLPEAREIVSPRLNLEARLKRVDLHLPENLHEAISWEELARRLEEFPQVLCVVNSRKDCRELWKLMPTGSFHLSAQMCPQHRSELLQEIRRRLAAGVVTRVVSTQLIEAGVDIDFPAVFRALAGLDSIAQAAGRCNREGRQACGHVEVFVPPTSPPPGILTMAAQSGRSVLRDTKEPLSAAAYDSYFRDLYWKLGPERRDCGVIQACKGNLFQEVDRRYRLIDDQQRSVVVSYGEGSRLQRQLEDGYVSRQLYRRLQRYTVGLNKWVAEKMLGAGLLEEYNGILVQKAENLYCYQRGLLTGDDSRNDLLMI